MMRLIIECVSSRVCVALRLQATKGAGARIALAPDAKLGKLRHPQAGCQEAQAPGLPSNSLMSVAGPRIVCLTLPNPCQPLFPRLWLSPRTPTFPPAICSNGQKISSFLPCCIAKMKIPPQVETDRMFGVSIASTRMKFPNSDCTFRHQDARTERF